MKILKTISLFTIFALLAGCQQSNDSKNKTQNLICTGEVIIDRDNKTCLNQEIKFTLVIKNSKITVENEPCLSRFEFDKFKKDNENDLLIEFSRKFINPISNHEILHSFGINKVSGEFGLGESDLTSLGLDPLSVSGFCKRVNTVIE